MRRIRIAVVLALTVLAASLLAAGAQAFGIVQEPLPTGYVGQAYSYQVKVNGGNPPYEFTVKSGGLPPGISLSKEGLISGKPTQGGSWKFYIEGSYQFGSNPRVYSQRQFTLNVIVGLAIEQQSLPTMLQGVAFSRQLTATGGGTQTWSIVSGAAPTGLTLSSTGLLSGTPTAVGRFTFTVRVTDGTRKAEQAYTVDVIQALTVTAPGELPPAVVGSAFNLTLTATGGRAPYTWSIKDGAWPRGLTFANGVISGKPRVAGAYAFNVLVTDLLNNQVTLPISLVVQPRLKIPAQTLRAGKVGRAYAGKILTRGGAAPLFFELDGGELPAGMRLNAKTGALVGKPRTAGRFSFVVRVTDEVGGTHSRRLTLRVLP